MNAVYIHRLPVTQGVVTYMLLVEVSVTRIKIFDQRKLCLITCMIMVGPMFHSEARALSPSFKRQSYTLVSLILADWESLIRYGLANSKLILVANSCCGNTQATTCYIATLIIPCSTAGGRGPLHTYYSPHIHTHTYAPPHTDDACTGSNSGTQ